ncbi:MAG: hypothetical protein ACTSRA_11290 [Promethearchaeota archaeon]
MQDNSSFVEKTATSSEPNRNSQTGHHVENRLAGAINSCFLQVLRDFLRSPRKASRRLMKSNQNRNDVILSSIILIWECITINTMFYVMIANRLNVLSFSFTFLIFLVAVLVVSKIEGANKWKLIIIWHCVVLFIPAVFATAHILIYTLNLMVLVTTPPIFQSYLLPALEFIALTHAFICKHACFPRLRRVNSIPMFVLGVPIVRFIRDLLFIVITFIILVFLYQAL